MYKNITNIICLNTIRLLILKDLIEIIYRLNIYSD